MTDGLRTYFPSLTEIRAIALASRRRSPSDHRMPVGRRSDAEPDEELLAIVGDPFASVDDAYTRLRGAEEHLRERTDRRSVFLTVYTEMTANVQEGIESGAFDDPDWVRDYLVAFANRYREVLLAYERRNFARVPLPWRIGFDASLSGYTLLVQDALLGINAHINYDLAYTLRDVSIDPDRPSKLRDHNRINDVLHQLVDVVQRALADVYAASGYTRVDSLFGSFDEDFTLIGLSQARTIAWQNAILLTDRRSARVQWYVNWRVRSVSAGAAYFILAPSADRTILWALRQIERDDPPIATLHDAFQQRVQERPVHT